MSYIVTEGNVTTDATLREFASKRTGELIPISNATIAVNDRRYNAETDQWVDTGKTFYELTIIGTEASHFAATATKGTRVFVAGNSYVEEDVDNEGNKRVRRRISAEHHGLSSKFAAVATKEPANTAS
jgi:single-strand DNA-binding protein